MSVKERLTYDPDYAVPPGETLREIMRSLGMTQSELAKRSGLTQQSLIRIFKGMQPISYETANALELTTGVPAGFWNRLEANYRERLAKLEERKRLQDDLEWLKSVPVKELRERGRIQEQSDKISLLREVLKFYGVSSVESWKKVWTEPAVAARRSQCFETDPVTASAWIQQGRIDSLAIDCRPYQKQAFENTLNEIRELTVQEKFDSNMRSLCANAGVALVFVPKMKKVPWHGASQWLAPDKAMIMLNLRGKREDQFWFSFFHEAAHILHDSKRELYINDGDSDDPCEIRANEFAANFLIPDKYNSQIALLRSKSAVRKLANELHISPGIVVGRYQKLTNNFSWFNDLKRKFEWVPISPED